MGKAIYGLAMPFNDSYFEYDWFTNTLKYETTNKESVTVWNEVVATIDHDYDRTIGTTKENLDLVINDRGVFFRVLVNERLGYEAYGRVSRKEVKHCSITYLKRYSSDIAGQVWAESIVKLFNWKESVVVNKYDEILITEVCLTSNPANQNTFCTTNKKDPRLKGVKWDG